MSRLRACVLIFAALAATAHIPAADATVVFGGTGTTHPTIASAIAVAQPGDTVIVAAGTYREHSIDVDKRLVILGSGSVVIDAEEQGEILTITADSTTVRGLELRNVGTSFMEDRAAIRLADVKHCLVEENRFINAFFGVYLENSEYCLIRNNTLLGTAVRESTSGNGIHLWYCRNIDIVGNHVQGHRDGIYLEFVEDSRVNGNTSTYNLRYGLHFMFSHRDVYEDNVFADNGAGVAVMYSNDVHMLNNRFDHNWGRASYGLLLKEIKDSNIAGNVFTRNTTALYSEGSNRLTVSGNSFTNNGYAVRVMANSMDNKFIGNDFIGNSFDVATNSKQNFNTFDGNYWSEYKGYDLDRDGVGDVPHHPVRLFTILVEQQPPGVILMHSLFVRMIDTAERIMPVFTPETLVDANPQTDPLAAAAPSTLAGIATTGAARP